MIDYLAHRKRYQHAVKYRCVARFTIFPELAREGIRTRYFERANISARAFDRYWRVRRGGDGEANSDKSAIADSVSYLFQKSQPPYRAGRFNREEYAALYTARDIATAKAERFYYVGSGGGRFEYVVYSVAASGEVADLRPLIDSGNLVLGSDHSQCQTIADAIRFTVGGVAWYSIRNPPTGACCAFFSCEGILPRKIEEDDVR